MPRAASTTCSRSLMRGSAARLISTACCKLMVSASPGRAVSSMPAARSVRVRVLRVILAPHLEPYRKKKDTKEQEKNKNNKTNCRIYCSHAADLERLDQQLTDARDDDKSVPVFEY